MCVLSIHFICVLLPQVYVHFMCVYCTLYIVYCCPEYKHVVSIEGTKGLSNRETREEAETERVPAGDPPGAEG